MRRICDKGAEISFIFVTVLCVIGFYLWLGVLGWAALVLVVLIPLYIIRIVIISVLNRWESSLKWDEDRRYMLIIFAVWAVLGCLVLSNLDVFLLKRLETSLELKALGFIVSCIGVSLMFWSVYTLGFLRTARLPEVFPSKYGEKLIRGGVYDIVRHPFFLSELCIIAGNFLLTEVLSLLFLFLGWLLFLPHLLRWEEKKLIQKFGGEYMEYKREVGGVIPKF